ncbi:MAG: cation:proton antiporter [Blastocatellia bacterium]|nr:cation:proton antiporter [Blastocatellia bacterium]
MGELIAGIILGNLVLFGFDYAEPLKTDVVISTLAQLGIIVLLFEVGLETDFDELKKVGLSSFLVAVIGIIAPFILGWLVAKLFLGEMATLSHIFIAAMLCATSIGITARVFKDLGKIDAREAQIILGAAVIDDVLALLVLAIVEGAIFSQTNGTNLEISTFTIIALKAIGFLVGAILLGKFLVPKIFDSVKKFESKGMVLGLSLAICFLFAWAASMVGLAAIIGAFAAGLVLEEASFEHFLDHNKHDLIDFLSPITVIFAPIFFVSIGMKVDLRAFGNPELLIFASALTLAAILGKQACSLGVLEKGLNKLAIGFGMIPRGEVVLFFAAVGATLSLPNASGINEPVINSSTFSAIVILVMITALLTPPALKWSLNRKVGENT